MGKRGDKEVLEKFFDMLRYPEMYPQAKAIYDLIKTTPVLEKKSADKRKEVAP